MLNTHNVKYLDLTAFRVLYENYFIHIYVGVEMVSANLAWGKTICLPVKVLENGFPLLCYNGHVFLSCFKILDFFSCFSFQ